jgi:carboxymethylenebutenolidase
MPGQDVEFPSNGTTTTGYLAIPESGSGPGLIVIQEWWGLNDQIRRTADRFAQEGFVALAPDFYHGRVVNIGEPDEAGKMFMALNSDQVAKDARGAAQFLLKHPAVRGYGFHPNIKPDFSKLQAPVLLVFAEKDASVNAEVRKQLENQLKQAGIRFESHTYPGVDHAFMNDERPEVYDPATAEDAWRRAVTFLQRELGH